MVVSFIGGGNRSTQRKHDLLQVTDKLYHIMLFTSPWTGFELTSVVIGTDCIGSCKSNYYTMTAPSNLLTLSISDEVYYRNVFCTLKQIPKHF